MGSGHHSQNTSGNLKKVTRKHRHYERGNLLTSPGTLTYVGPEVELKTRIRKIRYNEKFIANEAVKTLADCIPSTTETDQITWLDVDGIHETSLIEKLGKLYNLHPLLLEDVVNSEHKPKLEVYDNHHVFLTMKMLHYSDTTAIDIASEHVSFVLGDHFLISFQEERNEDIFIPVLNRLEASVGKTRKNGADYLLFALMDVIVDNYFIVLEKLGDNMDHLEDSILAGIDKLSLTDLYALKRELTLLRRIVWPIRDMINQLIREENPLVSRETIPYYRDLYDHIMQIIDTVDSYREVLASLADVHLSTISNRMNSVMKTLTIFSAIFMPLTFIVGVYGMNFDHMPELHHPYGYFCVWGIMIVVTAGMVIYFKTKKWI
ncbi:Cobalt/magnesium transport protein CorA [Dyadobacter sp. CECT 9275]|uniref:Magnesium transport protein CorA n=1 Tax=Dyadobacter helix TaxID=2822344 RepID=A0A916J7T3_9BACT|nr:magnesium/cobalt transporter CorA [Dyadobacter sp. CECT 9275]CAG4991684.1 Cobalt/magnesium transport protein CorA [Dyadobacter sp. CECT 9275]